MNIFLLAFTACNDVITNERLLDIKNSNNHPNLDHVFVESVDQSCRGVSYWPYGSPQEHGINTSNVPVVLFLGWTGTANDGEGVYTEVARIQGNAVNSANIEAKLRALAGELAPPLTDGAGGPSDNPGQGGVIPTTNDSGGGFGFGFGGGWGLPGWIWWIAAAGAGYKAATSKARTGQVIFGTLTGLAVTKALKSNKPPEVGYQPQLNTLKYRPLSA